MAVMKRDPKGRLYVYDGGYHRGWVLVCDGPETLRGMNWTGIRKGGETMHFKYRAAARDWVAGKPVRREAATVKG